MAATPKPYQVVYDGPTQQLQYAVVPADWTPINIVLTSYTTTQKNAIPTPLIGMLVFDSTLGQLSVWTGSAWHNA
jgi:hypothetical protein